MLEEFLSQAFWIGLLKIIGVNIILSGDNAVVIALAARSLPQKQQKQAVFWGAGAAILLRIILTLFAVALLTLPWLKIVGSLLLFWIGIKLLIPEEDDGEIEASDQLLAAIKTILVADLVMSLDNVIAVAAAAGGSVILLVLGLAISIPLVIFGATLLIKLMERFPVIITIGAGLIGWVAGEMLVADSALEGWFTGLGVQYVDGHPKVGGFSLEILAGIVGIVIVVAAGTLLARRKSMGTVEPQVAASPTADAQQTTDGFQLVIEALKLNGLDTIYGLPGIPITDLTRRAQAAGMRVLSFRHEQSAGYAASIAGFLTQKPGICLTVSAPGFLNGLNALAHAGSRRSGHL